MRIAIIGGGFYGCYLAFKLKTKFKSKYKIDIFEKNSDLLKEAAINNQWRLHLGFHYPRSNQTIRQCVEGYKLFARDFKKYIFYPNWNLYLIHKKSKTSFKRFLKIYDKFNLKIEEFDLNKLIFLRNKSDYLGAIKTKEGVIKFDKLNKFLKKKILNFFNLFLNTQIIKVDNLKGILKDLKGNIFDNYDYILNCTYTDPNLGNKKKFRIKYELVGMVEAKNPFKKKIAITIVDGPYISLYPRTSKTVSLSSVKHTPIKKVLHYKNIHKLENVILKNKQTYINKIVKDVKKYFIPNLNIKIVKLILSTKVKPLKDNQDQRPTLLTRNNKVFNILCGKIDAAPLIFNKIIKNIYKKN